jgi:hypothetical protein
MIVQPLAEMKEFSDGLANVERGGDPSIRLPDIQTLEDLYCEDLVEPEELVEGILHRGSKMVLGGGSKSFKTWMLIDLATSVAYGLAWMGAATSPGRTLFVNFEIQSGFFRRRVQEIISKKTEALVWTKDGRLIVNANDAPLEGSLDILNLRGMATNIDELKVSLMNKISGKDYSLIIFDPLYKMLGDRDENSAGDMASLLNALEAIAVKSGAAIVFGAHFSKGNQAGKESMDRISGSGVLARDPDTILVLTQHELDGVYVVQSTLRNFPSAEHFCVKWDFPLMVRDDNADPKKLRQPRRTTTGKTGRMPTEKEFTELFPKSWPEWEPEKGLLSNSDLRRLFTENDWDKTTVPQCRAEYGNSSQLEFLTGLPKGKILGGRTSAIHAYKKHRAEKKREMTKRSSKR